jgi:hypothetical protein
MDLFAASGIDLGDGGRGGRGGRPAIARTLRVPLLAYKVVAEARKVFTFAPTPQQRAAAANYAKTAKSAKFARQKETAVRALFTEKVLGEILGYTPYDSEQLYTLAHERAIRSGAVDVAVGRFGGPDNADDMVAPFELKGPGTRDLDAIMPGRGRSPVQQAWDYAIDAPGSRWVLVSNCIEIRLYGFGRGRDAYELFDLTKLDDPEEHERLCMILSAERFLGGATDALLRETDSAYKTITDDLYLQYRSLRESLVQFLTDSADGPKLALASAIEPAQKILDRILFIAFAQRTALLPDRLLQLATKATNEFRPEPLWRNFQGLFHGVDKGNDRLNIWPYNGGLFAPDPVVDAIELPDEMAKSLAALGEWDYRNDVPVTLLGHLFEQSITDLEKLRAASRGEEPPKVSQRKRQGVVYTPDVVTRFMVERTVGLTLSQRFEQLLAAHGKATPSNGDPIFTTDERDKERDFWRDYAGALRALRIVDPACGSGAFLVAAFNLLAAEYRRVVEHLTTLEETVDFDPFDEIVMKNLYGVDLNAESVEITRLALWLKTARNQHRLQNLEATIKVGNSLIDDPAFTDRPFDWRAAFPDVFAQGGFDIVVGNPPYVRMELIKPVKPYLEKKYVVADDRTDLYAYFFERGVGILKDGGRLGYISSSTFFRTGSGENLRRFLGDNVAIEAVVDFGDLQIFEGVTTYPAIVTLRKGEASDEGALAFLRIGDDLPKDLGAAFTAQATAMPRARLGGGPWRLEDDAPARLREKIVAGKKTLDERYGSPTRGVLTGLNEAFVITRPTRDAILSKEPSAGTFIKPFLRGDDAERWRIESKDQWLIVIPNGWTRTELADKSPPEEEHLWSLFRKRFPILASHLAPFESKARNRYDQGEFWWELRSCSFYAEFERPKIVYPVISQGPKFSADTDGYYLNDKAFMIAYDALLLALLNSRLIWFFLFGTAASLRGGMWRLELREIYIS